LYNIRAETSKNIRCISKTKIKREEEIITFLVPSKNNKVLNNHETHHGIIFKEPKILEVIDSLGF